MKSMFQRSTKGFTLIELLVVIAIIAILSTIVLAALGGARQRARNTRIQSEMSSMRAQAELYYTASGLSYGDASSCGDGMFSDTTVNGLGGLVASIEGQSNSGILTCQANGDAWAASFAFGEEGGESFCVDSTGFAGSGTATDSSCVE